MTDDSWEVRVWLWVGDSWCWVDSVLGVNLRSWHGQIERDNLTLCYLVMLELWIHNWEIRGNWGNHHEKLELMTNSFALWWTIPNMGGTTPDLADRNTDIGCAERNQAGHTPNFPYLLKSSDIIPIFISILILLIHNSTITWGYTGQSLHSVSPWDVIELILSTVSIYHWPSPSQSHCSR